MSKNLFFTVVIVAGLLAQAGGCGGNRHTVITVTAEAAAYERVPFYEGGGNATITYRLETHPYSTLRQ